MFLAVITKVNRVLVVFVFGQHTGNSIYFGIFPSDSIHWHLFQCRATNLCCKNAGVCLRRLATPYPVVDGFSFYSVTLYSWMHVFLSALYCTVEPQYTGTHQIPSQPLQCCSVFLVELGKPQLRLATNVQNLPCVDIKCVHTQELHGGRKRFDSIFNFRKKFRKMHYQI